MGEEAGITAVEDLEEEEVETDLETPDKHHTVSISADSDSKIPPIRKIPLDVIRESAATHTDGNTMW